MAALCFHLRAIASIITATLRARGGCKALEQAQDATPKARFYGRGIGQRPCFIPRDKKKLIAVITTESDIIP